MQLFGSYQGMNYINAVDLPIGCIFYLYLDHTDSAKLFYAMCILAQHDQITFPIPK